MSESLVESVSLSEELQSTSSLQQSPVNDSSTLTEQSQSIEDTEKRTSSLSQPGFDTC